MQRLFIWTTYYITSYHVCIYNLLSTICNSYGHTTYKTIDNLDINCYLSWRLKKRR